MGKSDKIAVTIIVVIGIVLFVIWPIYFQDSDDVYDKDEEGVLKYVLEHSGYEVNSVELTGKTLYTDMNASAPKGSLDWDWQVWEGLTTSVYEVEPTAHDILKIPKSELESLGIDYDRIERMSIDRLEEVAEIIGNRASMFVVIMNTPTEVCSYSLSRETYRIYTKASDICRRCDLTISAYSNAQNEIKNSEVCY